MEYVVSEKEADAKKKLKNAGFKVTVVYEEDTSKDDGVVLKQSIGTGEQVDEGTNVTLTVNKIAKLKQGIVNINLKSLINGIIEKDEEGNEINPNVQVEIRVNDETVYKQQHRKDTMNINKEITGKGTVTVKVFIDGVKEAEETLNLNDSKPVLNID